MRIYIDTDSINDGNRGKEINQEIKHELNKRYGILVQNAVEIEKSCQSFDKYPVYLYDVQYRGHHLGTFIANQHEASRLSEISPFLNIRIKA